jgi:hypothetical protein
MTVFKLHCFALFLVATAGAWEPLKLISYPQKVRTFFSLDDTNVPSGLRADSAPLPLGGINASVRATDRAMWLGTTRGQRSRGG